MFKCIHGEKADDVWAEAYNELSNSNIVQTRLGNSSELMNVGLSIENPVQKWVTVRRPIISIGYALAELIWFLSGKQESKVINYWNSALSKYAGNGEHYPGAYGYRIQYSFGFNQLERAFHVLKNNPNNRQVVISIWNPKIDLPFDNGQPTSEDIPCNICSLIKIRNNKLEWTQIMRSNDLIRGLPYNLIQFTSLQEILSSWLHVAIGTYNHYSDSLHIYESDNNFSLSNNIAIEKLDSLAIKKEDFINVINSIYDIMSEISLKKADKDRLKVLSEYDTGYVAYNNILKIICTYASFKEGYRYEEKNILESCENLLYKEMWKEWRNSRKD